MRFADEFVEHMGRATTKFQTETGTAETRLIGQDWKLAQATAAFQIASGENGINNALDMIVLVSLSRMVVADSWIGRYGDAAQEILDVYVALEPQAWSIMDSVMSDAQRQALRDLLGKWRSEHPDVTTVAFVRFADFAAAGTGPGGVQPRSSGTGLFGLLGLDPLAGLDPAVREVQESRMLAERGLYYVMRTPILIDMQIQHLTFKLVGMPETRDLLEATTRVGKAAESVAGTTSQLPEVLAHEREAAIAQFMEAMQSQEEQARALLVDLKGTLDSGTQTADSVTATIRSLDTLMARFKSATPATEPAQPSRPFDITEYASAAAEFARTARELQVLVASLDENAPKVNAAVLRVTEGGKGVVDYVFNRALLLTVILLLGVLLTAVTYKLIARRLER